MPRVSRPDNPVSWEPRGGCQAGLPVARVDFLGGCQAGLPVARVDFFMLLDGDMGNFLERYGDIKSKERIDKLHESICLYILCRLKEDVEKSVPPQEETLIEVELTVLRNKDYRALYANNVYFLHKSKQKALDGPRLNNLAMQLRKFCNHPFPLRGVEEEIREQEAKSSEKVMEGDFLAQNIW